MTLAEEFLKFHPCVDSSIIDALQGRARCESDAIQKEWEEYTKAVLPKAKPPGYNYIDPSKDDSDLKINVKRRNIKFNFNN